MFDWDGEELANIIWGEASENEDHIVPYPDETYGKPPGPYREHHEAANVKLSEKTPVNITDLQSGSNTHHDKHGALSMDGFDSPLDLSLSNATKQDLEHMDEKAHVGSGSQFFDKRPEDTDASNFVDYGWANVGSFNDIDRILSNNDTVYGNANILCVNSPSVRLGDLRSDCEHVETKSEFIKDENQTDSHGKNENAPKEKSTSNIVRRTPSLVYSIGAPNVAMAGEFTIGKHTQMGEQRKSLGYEKRKGQKCEPWFPSTYQQFHSCEEPPAGSSSLMPLRMTPQEKIEKLRRRQQMRALLAIRNQQQEFRHQPMSNNSSNFMRCSNEGQFDESLSTFMSVDGSSSLEKSDLDIRLMMMNTRSLEDTILQRLENVIATLDIQIRVCIRDSLFRLAQSALQRKYAGDISSMAASNVASSSARTPDGETKTNPIDRAVAHLLFHRPPELSGELVQSLESPSSGSRVEMEGSSRGVTHL